VWPIGVAVVIGLLGRWPNVRDGFGVAAACVPALLLLAVLRGTDLATHGTALTVPVGSLVPGVTWALRADALGLVYALVATTLWPVTALYAVGYLRGHHEQDQTRFFASMALSIAAALLVAFAGDLVALFVAYEALTVTTFPLVTHHQDEPARAAGRRYLGMLMGTSVGLLLPAIVWTWTSTGELAFRSGGFLEGRIEGLAVPVLLLLFAYGAGKAALMPLHGWLPAAMVAPTPVSALLHAVAVVKAGVFVVLRVVHDVFGAEWLTGTGGADALRVIAAASLVVASAIAVSKTNLKARLAYSTVAHLAYVTLAATLGPWGWAAGAAHVVGHALGKITLFFVAGAVFVTAHVTDVRELDGLGRRMPWTMGAFAVGALGVAGLPPALGGVTKVGLVQAAADAGSWLALGALGISTLLSVLYLGEIVGRAFFRAPVTGGGLHGDDPHHADPGDHGEADWRMRLPLLLTASASVAAGFGALLVGGP
jgi:multicomponent Na+:H+ antiporter subunit D